MSLISQFCKHRARFATTFPSHATVREEIGALERLQLMLLDLVLTHTASGGLQTWIPGFSRALLSSEVYNMLRLIIFRTRSQIVWRPLFSTWRTFLLRRFQTQQSSLFNSSSGIAEITVELVSFFLFANTSSEESFKRPIGECCNPGIRHSKLQSL